MEIDDAVKLSPNRLAEIARSNAQMLADLTRRAAFMIAWRNDDGDDPFRYVVSHGLMPDEFEAFMHDITTRMIVEQFRPKLEINDTFCEACCQIVYASTIGGRPWNAVLFRADDGINWHSSKNTEHTAEHCLEWTRFFVKHGRAAFITYEGAS